VPAAGRGLFLQALALTPDVTPPALAAPWLIARTQAFAAFSWDAKTFNLKECSMNNRLMMTIAMASIAASSLGACSGMSQRDKNTATGAAIGGAAGAVLTGGSPAGTVGGAAVGGVIGNQIDPNKK